MTIPNSSAPSSEITPLRDPDLLSGAKVLIVDDIPANLKVLREVLEPRGFRILFAPRGDVALKIARSESPDLILLDVMMPEMDGFEVCRQLKSQPATAPIPVIFITAKDEADDIVRGLTVGGVDYISKPFQAEVVVARVETHLGNGRLTAALQRKNRELELANEAVEKARKAQSTFLATMSHEIRTPMNSVLGMTALLLEMPLSAEQQDCVETIRTSSRSLLGIIEEILDFSKIESGRMTFETQPFDLAASVEEVLEILGVKAAEKKLELAYLPERGLPHTVIGDVTRLRQILLNLAGNALKFTERGEVVITARREPMAESPDPGSTVLVRFSVRDTGIGLSPEQCSRLFQAFTQADSSTTRKYGGTGLGLAISQRLTELMGGRMWVESEPNAGSTFHFSMPFTIPNDAPAPVLPNLSPLVGRRALIVEGHAVNREILDRTLTEAGLHPHAVPNGTEALHDLETNPAGLLVVSSLLPDGDGLEFIQAIRLRPATADVPVILLSSGLRSTPDPRASELRVNAVFHKPIRRSHVVRALRRVVRPDEPDSHLPAAQTFDSNLAARHPLRILLADDHPFNQKVGARILDRFGYSCEIAANGVEVLAALERQPFDVVLLDVQMPEMDGYEAAREIHRRWREPDRPRLIAMTANALATDRDKCLEAGMDDYIAKPVEIANLRRVLEKSRPRSAPMAGNLGSGRPPAEGAASGPDSGATAPPPVDWPRFKEMLGEDAATIREFVGLYMRQTARQLEQIHQALESGTHDDIELLAHACCGASATCGVAVMLEPMRRLERAANTGDFSGAMQLWRDANESYQRVAVLFEAYLASLESPASRRPND